MQKQTVLNNNQLTFEFQGLKKRRVVADFNGGSITSDAGVFLLREVDEIFGITDRLVECFSDRRASSQINHPLSLLLRQRIFGLALGYEDVDDHETLRYDPSFAAAVGREEPTEALAGKSTLNRLELSSREAGDRNDRYHRMEVSFDMLSDTILELSLDQMEREGVPDELILDIDATDDPLHGEQEGRFFHGYYRHYCYMPLYVFAGSYLLLAKLRPSNIDGAKGSVEELERIVTAIHARWPKQHVIIRGDSGFCRDDLLVWCEKTPGVDYVIGLAKNARLKKQISSDLEKAEKMCEETGRASRIFSSFHYRTLKSWNCSRRVVAKAEHLEKGSNPRFVVTSLDLKKHYPRAIYEELYCARGDMENRIKEQQLCLFADRTSTHWMRSNQFRLWLSSVAYMLLNALRRFGLKGTEMARAMCDSIRLKLLKIGALVRISVRRVLVSMASGYPWQDSFSKAVNNLTALRE